MDLKQFLRKFILHASIISSANLLNYDQLSKIPLPEGRLDASVNPEISNSSVSGSPCDNTKNYVTCAAEISIEFIWKDVLTYSQLFLVLLGLIANVGTLITLFLNGKDFSHAILILLKHQSAADAMACLFSLVIIVQPEKPFLSGIYFIDVFICNFWFNQGMFWSTFYVSIWNLVLLACERYLAVCHPFKHQELTCKRVHIMIFGIYLLVAAVHGPGYYFFFRLSDGMCVILPTSSYQIYFSFVFVLFFYFIPCTLFVVLYGLVILAFSKRQKQSHLGVSRVIDKATSELTKTAIIVTVIFIVTLGLNMWYIFLNVLGVVQIIMYGPIHVMSIWLCSLNSAANPFVYSLLMPAYRKSVQNTFYLKCKR